MSSQDLAAPPVAARIPHPTTLHGTTLQDDYFWLREKTSPQVLAYLEAENAHTSAAMAGTEDLQQRLYDEVLSHIQEDDASVPYRDGEWEYLTRTAKGSQYARYCRYPAGQPAQETVFLDVNLLADGQPYMAIGGLAMSPNGRLLAYTTDTTGFRQYTLHLRDTTTGQEIPFDRPIERVGSLVWAADSTTLFFTTEDEQTKRQDRAFRLELGGTAVEVFQEPVEVFEEPVLVFEEKDERFNLGLGRTGDRQYLLLESGSHTTNEIRYMASENARLDEFRLFAPRIDDEEYHIDHHDGFWFIRTNHKAEQFRLMYCAHGLEDGEDREFWLEVMPEQKDAPLEDFDLFKTFIVLSYRERGLPVLRVFHLTERLELVSPQVIAFPDPAYEAYSEINRDFNATTFRYAYQSLVRPASVFRYDVATGVSTLLKQQTVPGGFDAANYESARLWFPAADGTKVPVSLVYRKDKVRLDGQSPLYVYGYGSYGYALPLGFSAARLALLDRGIVVAYAHIRGGGELGDPWHDAGKMMAKRNTFTDFLEAVEFLTRSGYGDPARVAIEGGSAGGLLMGAVVNLALEQGKPELFRAVLSHVPFVDVMNTMLDASLPLTVAEYEEWGNPNEPEAFACMASYSPYDNLRPGPYPAMLVKTSLNDSQVMYWEPAKYVARLRTLKTNATPLLLHINMDAGHGGASGRYDYLKEIAFDHAFLLRELGIED